MEDPITFKKAVTSLATGKFWVKVVMFSLGASVLFFVGFAVYKAYIKKPDATTFVKAEKGSIVTVIQKDKRFLIPFVEVFAEQKDKFQTGIRAGVRIEF